SNALRISDLLQRFHSPTALSHGLRMVPSPPGRGEIACNHNPVCFRACIKAQETLERMAFLASERSAARLAHQSGGLGVGSSNLPAPTSLSPEIKGFLASSARATKNPNRNEKTTKSRNGRKKSRTSPELCSLDVPPLCLVNVPQSRPPKDR